MLARNRITPVALRARRRRNVDGNVPSTTTWSLPMKYPGRSSVGKPTRAGAAGETWIKRGGMGSSRSGTRSKKVGKTAKNKETFVPPTKRPKWANKYL
jgi:hypothetical protein